MSLSQLLQDFSDAKRSPEEVNEQVEEQLADQTLKSFEEGYTAGWDDAVKAHEQAKVALSTTVQKELEQANLTVGTAKEAFSKSTEALFSAVVSKLLPDLAQTGLPDLIVTELQKALAAATDVEAIVKVSTDQQNAVATALEEHLGESFSVICDPELSPGQACFAVGETETHIDLPRSVDEISEKLRAFEMTTESEKSDV